MATRRGSGRRGEAARGIRAAQLVDRLQDHALGIVELTTTQVRAAEILLRLAVPAAPVEMTGKDGGPIETHDTGVVGTARRIAFILSQGLRAAEGAT